MTANEQMQYTVIGTLIAEPKRIGALLTKLHPSDFTSLACRGLYEALGSMHFDGAPINRFTLLDRAGEAYGEAVIEAAGLYTEDLEYYASQIHERSRLDAMQRIGEQLASAPNAETASMLISRLHALTAEKSDLAILDAAQAAAAFINSQAAPPPDYFRWGFSELDSKLYVEPGDYVVIGGFASSGKTLLSLQFASELADTYRVGYFTIETSPKKLVDRMISNIARIPLSTIKRHDLSEAQWDNAAAASAVLSRKRIEFVPAAGMTVSDIRAIALSRRYDVIFVDYLQIVTARGANRYEEVTNISKDLHTLAQANGITVIALAQLSRPEKTEKGKKMPPNMSSFRESGQIEQDADVALLLWPSDPDNNRSNRILKCGKNKDGERFRIELEFDGAMQTLRPVEAAPVPDWVRKAERAPQTTMEGFQNGQS